jgi:pilus assembly protein CpaF
MTRGDEAGAAGGPLDGGWHTSTRGQLVHEVCRRLAASHHTDPAVLLHHAAAELGALAPLMADGERRDLAQLVVDELRGLGSLEPLLADPTVTDILVNPGGDVWVERDGTLRRSHRVDPGLVEVLIERMVAPLGRRIDRSHPVVDARLPDGSRVCALLPPVAVDGPSFALRRFATQPLGLHRFAPPPVQALLAEIVDRRCNVVVSGGTGTGKSTLLGALAARFPAHHRIVTVEDVAEIRLGNEHVLRLECVPSGADGPSPVTLGDLIRTALRLRPDRLLVGEVRGPEAFHLVQALNTGHAGSITTVHANDATGALRRLITLVALGSPGLGPAVATELVASAVDIVVHLERDTDGARQVTVVDEVLVDEGRVTTRTLAGSRNAAVGAPSRGRAA